jgi:hypothetical protein
MEENPTDPALTRDNRLERCRRDVVDPRTPGARSPTSVGLGLVDPWADRAFRGRYAQPPDDYRTGVHAAARIEAAPLRVRRAVSGQK